MPRVLSASELEENARALYRVGKYYDALTNIKEAVARASKPTPAQLELLIASQAKTEDHEGALQNSKALIRQYASEPAGYIRAAGILHKINRPQAALKIYERGLNTVPHNHASYPKMKEKHRELLASLTSATRTDPLTILPLEVVEMILQYLSFKQRVICIRVSKAWQRLLYSIPQSWTDLDLSQARRTVSGPFINRCFKASRFGIELAYVHRVKNLGQVVESLAKSCNKLHSLVIQHAESPGEQLLRSLPLATRLRTLTFSMPMKPGEARRVLLACPEIASFRCSALETERILEPWNCFSENLRALTLNAMGVQTSMKLNIHSIIEHASMLKELRLNDWHSASDQLPIDFSRLTSLEHLEYGEGFEMPVNIPQSLTTLNQEKIPYLWTVSPTYICPHLRHVACHDLQTLKALLGEDGNVGASKLQSLKVSQLDPEETDWKTSPLLSDRLTELHELALLSSRKVDDGLVPVLIERMTKLEFIDLSYSDITGYGVKQLVANLPNLKKLLLKYCNDLSSDAVEWARTQRIKIEGASAWSIVGKSARSVRYGP